MRRAWVRLDNASNVFLAARSAADPKVFRVGVELDHPVDPRLLQAAVDATFDRYQLFHAVLRRGVFWYYLQASDLRPRVTAEELPTCAPLYQPDRRRLLFRVVHHDRRISLEVFHALADGTGALWFLRDVVAAYVRSRSALGAPDLVEGPDAEREHGADASGPVAGVARPVAPVDDPAGPVHTLAADSFAHYFRRRRRSRSRPVLAADRSRPEPDADFRQAAAAPVSGGVPPGPVTGSRLHRGASSRVDRLRKGVYRVRGTRTPDDRTRAVELTVPARDVLALARAEGVSLTMYVYLVVLVALLCVYWDYLTGWRAWSLTYAVPIVCAGSALALMITVRLMRVEVGEHIVYTSLMLLLGLTPIAFLALGWETNAVPSSICGALGCTLVLLQLAQAPDLRHELAKRLHL